MVRSNAAEKIDLRLNNQIGIAFINRNMVLVIGENEATLLALNNDKPTNLNKFHYHNLNVLVLDDFYIDVKNKQHTVLRSNHEINGVKYSIKGGIVYVNYKGTNMCIYTGGAYNISECQFIYFYETNVSNLATYDYNEVVFHYYKNKLSAKILENLYEQAIDAYQLRDDELTIIRISENDYDLIVINNE
jgi:hypothetical protein